MSRAVWLGGAVAVSAALVSWLWWDGASTTDSPPFEPPSRLVEPTPLCPWREPESDVRRFFPSADQHRQEKRVLSGMRLELARQLGRQPEAEENVLTLHRVLLGSQSLGTVMTRRVKGEHGAIELVVAVTDEGKVAGVRLQRLREPAAVASALENREWLQTFHGRTHRGGWESDDLATLPPESHPSARGVVEGIRSLLVVLAVSEKTSLPSAVQPHH